MKTIKNRYKKNKSKKKVSKLMVGGKPKVSFPYSYFNLDDSLFIKYPILNAYLIGQTNACNDVAYGREPEFKYDENSRFLNSNLEKCVVVLKYDDICALLNNENLLDNITFLNKILGHAKLMNYEHKNVVGIFNICLHVFNITSVSNNGNTVLTERKPPKSGYGSILFNCVITSISFLFSNYTIWLGIDLKNVQFEKVAWTYISKGFSNPVITNTSPDDKVLPFNFMQLTKGITTYITNQDNATIPYHETIDLYKQFNTDIGKKSIFYFRFCFDKSAILSLRLMPFLSFSNNNIPVGIDTYSQQRETFGMFNIYNSYIKNDGTILYKLSLETISNNSLIKYITGSRENVPIVYEQRTFHTHPYINYSNYKTIIGPPSGPDWNALLDIAIIRKGQFHCVVSIEGIYIMNISIIGCLYLLKTAIPNNFGAFIVNNYEYPMRERTYDWSNYNILDEEVDENVVNDAITNYKNWFKNANNTFNKTFGVGGNFFDMHYIPWKDLKTDYEVTITYYNGKYLNIQNYNGSYLHIEDDPNL